MELNIKDSFQFRIKTKEDERMIWNTRLRIASKETSEKTIVKGVEKGIRQGIEQGIVWKMIIKGFLMMKISELSDLLIKLMN